MALMQEKLVDNNGIYAQEKFEELTPAVGTSIGFYLVETPMRSGDDGEFMVCNGLLIDLAAKSVDAMLETARAVSFIPKSILQSDIEEGGWNIGQIARLENDIRKGDKYKGKTVRYYHWKIFIQDAPNDMLKQLKDKVSELKGSAPAAMEEKPAASASKEKPAL